MKVLVVDDSKAMRMIVIRTLKQSGIANLTTVEAGNDGARRLLRVEADARVAFFLGKVEMAAQACQFLEASAHIRRLCLDFLHANTIRLMLGEPVFHPLAGGGTDAVEVEAGQFEQGNPHVG